MNTYDPIFFVEIGGSKLPEEISNHITSFSYEENEKMMDELRVTITNGDLSFVDNNLIQEGKEIRAKWGYVGNLSEIRTCTIKEINYSFGEDGLINIEIVAYDKRHKLTGRASRQCWKNKTVSQIVKDIAKKHNFKTVIKVENDVLYDSMSQGGKNDLVFLSKLAEESGCMIWVVNDELHFEPNKVTEPVYKFSYYKDSNGYLRSFRISSKAEEGKGTGNETEISGINPIKKEIIKESATQGS